MYAIFDARNKLTKPEEGKPLTPKNYKERVELIFQCYRVLNVFANPFANAMVAKFAEKIMPRKFEVFMYYVIHVNAVKCLLTAFVGDSWDKSYDFFQQTGLKMLAFNPTRFNSVGLVFSIQHDLNVSEELEKEAALFYEHEETAGLVGLHNYVGAIGPNLFELENDICELEFLSPTSCLPSEVIRKTKTAKCNGSCFHSLNFDLGMEYMEGFFNIVPTEIDLLSLQDVLENRQQLVSLVCEWQFVMSSNPISYEWYELPENSDVWQCLYEDKKKSVMYKSVCDMLDFTHVSNNLRKVPRTFLKF